MMARTRWLLLTVLISGHLRQAAAQGIPAATSTVIETADIERHVRALAADSFAGRATPSPGLDRAANYIAAEFERLGLRPGQEFKSVLHDSSWFDRYPVPGYRTIDPREATMWLAMGLRHRSKGIVQDDGTTAGLVISLRLDHDVYSALDRFRLPRRTIHTLNVQRMVLLAGRHTPASIDSAGIDGQMVLYVPPAELDSAGRLAMLERFLPRVAEVLVVCDRDSAAFANRLRTVLARPILEMDQYLAETVRRAEGSWAVCVRPGVLAPVFRRAMLDSIQIFHDTTPKVRPLLDVNDLMMWARASGAAPDSGPTAPNIIAVVDGKESDAIGRHEYVLVTAHLDTEGRERSVNNTTGVAALLAIAKAFRLAETPPRRSVAFVVTSGGAEHDTWGAARLAHNLTRYFGGGKVVAAIELDRLDPITADSLLLSGLEDVALATQPQWLAVQHPELGLRVVDGGTAAVPGSAAWALATAVVPTLRLHGPSGPDDRPTVVSSPSVASDRMARVSTFAFYLLHNMANALKPPRSSSGWRTRFLGADKP